MIVAIVVVILLISTAAYVLMTGDGEEEVEHELTATATPSSLEVEAGSRTQITVTAEFDGDSLVGDPDVTYTWTRSPLSLGTLDYYGRRIVNFTAATTPQTGVLNCTVEYTDADDVDYVAYVEIDVEVTPAGFATVAVTPSSVELAPGGSQAFTATAYDSVGGAMTGVTFTWSVTDMAAGDYTLNTTTGPTVTFTAVEVGTATLIATGTLGTETHSGSALINVTTTVYDRSIEYYWYDMFNVPNQQFWEKRWEVYQSDQPLTDSYPYLYYWFGNESNRWTYTSMRCDIDAQNITNINMNSNPQFMPFNGPYRGGNMVIDWYLDYMNSDEVAEYPGLVSSDDGWISRMTGTIKLDREAAMSVLNMTSDQFDNFASFWALNGPDRIDYIGDWFKYEGNERLDIYNAWEYSLMPFVYDMTGAKVGDEVVLTLNYITWGMDALMFRWLREAFMGTEYYWEDLTLHAEIGPMRSNVHVNAVAEYAVYAYEATLDGSPIWMWEALLQDVLPSSPAHPVSDYDPYVGLTYQNFAPGGDLYGQWMEYDYAPGAFNLDEDEVLIFTWPSGDQLFQRHVAPGIYENVTGPMTVRYSEPDPTDFPGQVLLDTNARTITFVGPLDLLNWSMTQDTHENLANEWDRLGVLPYGMPTIEFAMTGTPVLDHLVVENVTDPIEEGVSTSFDVRAEDQFNQVFPGMDMTVTFSSDDPLAVLPADYTFNPATDAGTHHFTGLVFNTPGEHYLWAEVVGDPSINGTQLNITVLEVVVADHLVVDIVDPVIAGDPYDITVTVYGSDSNVMTNYVGTVHFTSTDGAATLPADYTFVPGDAGVHTFTGGLIMGTDGSQTVTATDTADATVTGSKTITVLPARAPEHLNVFGVPSPADRNTDYSITVECIDQYGDRFTAYDGTVTFTTNGTGVTLPADYTFVPATDAGIHVFVDEVRFTSAGTYNITATDTADPTVWGSQEDIVVTAVAQQIDYFEVVLGDDSMWELNKTSVTVTAYSQLGLVFQAYTGTITFSTDATGTYTLPADYTFQATDLGVHTFLATDPDAVSFASAGTWTVTVEDTVVSTATGSDSIIIVGADSLVLEASETSINEGESVTLTVTAYAGGAVFTNYRGTVTFETTDPAGTVPSDYTFTAGDAGVHVFADGATFPTPGTWDVDVTDTANAALTDSVTVNVMAGGYREITYTVYDFLGPEWNPEAMEGRFNYYSLDYILSNEPGAHTELYLQGYSVKVGPTYYYQGSIYAPYRYSIDATNVSELNVHSPMFAPLRGAAQAGADVSLNVYFDYLNQAWWDSYWEPTWGTDPEYNTIQMDGQTSDGYFIGTVYTITMNRAGALEWFNMPATGDPTSWWNSNEETIESEWALWLETQGNVVYDIQWGYEWYYQSLQTWADMDYDSGTDTVTVYMANINYGYEVLMTRWLTAMDISDGLEPWYEDYTLDVDYEEDQAATLNADGVCQYSLHAVEANETSGGSAWVWEPCHIDYTANLGGLGIPTSKMPDTPSEYVPYANKLYTSHNAGDNLFEQGVKYEYTPTWFNLSAHEKLIFQLPTGNMLGYQGVGVDPAGYAALMTGYPPGDTSAFDAIEVNGEVSLGYHATGGIDLSPMWNDATKTLTIEGPVNFDNTRWPDGYLYHGAPWIEFNVGGTVSTQDVVSAPELDGAAAGASASSEVSTLVLVVSVTMLAVVALGFSARRRE